MKSVFSHVIIAAIAFSIGMFFGIREGWWQNTIYNGLLEASESRNKLTYIKNGDIKGIKGLEEVNLQAGLVNFYEYKNYKYPFLFFPVEVGVDEANYHEKLEKEFMNRIIKFVSENPESIKSHWDPHNIQPKNEQEEQWKSQAIENSNEFDRKLRSILDEYAL